MRRESGEIVTGEDGQRWRIGELLAVGCDEFPDANHAMCTQAGIGTDNVRYLGYHCPRCGKATSSQGHATTGKRVGGYPGEFRKFADGELHFPCEDGFDELELA